MEDATSKAHARVARGVIPEVDSSPWRRRLDGSVSPGERHL